MPTRNRLGTLILAALFARGGQEAATLAQEYTLDATWTWLRDAPAGNGAFGPGAGGPGQIAFDQAISPVATGKPQSFATPALGARLESHLSRLEPAQRAPLIEFLDQHEDLALEVASTLVQQDNIPQAWLVLAGLIESHGTRVAELAPLAAAICAVHDQPIELTINENKVELIEPNALFGYLAANERTLHFPPRETPAELLVHVADATGSVEQLDWARAKYARDRNVGNRYQEITYDTRSHTQGAEKRVTASGAYTLESIRRNGGVCADQTYFAMTVGKAIGVPACYVRGRGGEISHAWVGFLEPVGRRSVRWNFTEGRYKEYEDVQGRVRDPQTGELIPDAFLTIEALSAAATQEQRRESVALVDVARRRGYLAARAGGREAVTAQLLTGQLDALESSLRLNPGNLEAWAFAGTLVASPAATAEQRHRWTQAVDQLAGAGSPDFAFEILRPIFAAETDPAARFNLWGWAAGRFGARPDLAAQARLEQCRTLIAQGRKDDALAGCRAVFEEHADAGPVAVEALAMGEQLLLELGRGAEVMGLYEQAFRKLRQPRRMAEVFLVQTSWYGVGARYAELLDAAGEAREAETVRRRLNP